MKMKKAIALGLAVLMIVVASVAGTIAWLQAETETVTNTFSTAGIDITLVESPIIVDDKGNPTLDEDGNLQFGAAVEGTKNKYPAIPGTEYLKDPTVTVVAGSEECYLFVKFEEVNDPSTYYTYESALLSDNNWQLVPGQTNVWYRVVPESAEDTSFDLLVGNKITVKESVTNENMTDAAAAELIWTAYAIQLANTGTAAEAWAKIST